MLDRVHFPVCIGWCHVERSLTSESSFLWRGSNSSSFTEPSNESRSARECDIVKGLEDGSALEEKMKRKGKDPACHVHEALHTNKISINLPDILCTQWWWSVNHTRSSQFMTSEVYKNQTDSGAGTHPGSQRRPLGYFYIVGLNVSNKIICRMVIKEGRKKTRGWMGVMNAASTEISPISK